MITSIVNTTAAIRIGQRKSLRMVNESPRMAIQAKIMMVVIGFMFGGVPVGEVALA
jgi:hypothetical protein